ncbi:O-antigen ligase family protein [Candidatus Microgenomates bacterium]|nr:O-antigen ligase family protein [Candidatus Microgenomates bacterium]
MVISQNTFKNLHKKLFFLLILLLPTQLGFHFWPDWASVFGIRVDYLSPTVYLTDLLVVGILINWWGGNNLIRQIGGSNFKFPIFVLAYLLGTSLLIAQNQAVALYKLVKLVEFVLLGFYVFRNWKLEIGNWKFRAAFSAAMIYSCLIAWAQFLSGHTLGLWVLGERTFDINTPGIALANINGVDYLRPYATFPHPNVLAGFLLVGLLILVPLAPERSRRVTHTTLLMLLIISTLIITFSHSVWIAGLSALLFLNVEWFKKQAKIFTQIALWGIIFFSLAIPQITRDVETSTLPEEIGRRIELSRTALDMVRDEPLTGVGLGNFIVRLPEYGGTPQISWWLQPVHNVFLLILAETGIIGFGFIVWVLFKIAKLEIGNWKLHSSSS